MQPMKSFITILLIITSSFQIKQDPNLDTWIQSIVDDMIAFNDLDKYSLKSFPSDVKTNAFLVESVKDIAVKDDVISMLLNHGKGTYCTQIKFRYIKKQGSFYLVFPEPKKAKMNTKEYLIVDPWIEHTKICD
ncbi:hypothetical protein [uncultured Psychroserpens sp.]|uniref:hypothetical protein n=1 Tax=uncultured Psychroserpens sp. TaxID=255436 RepID=UPI002629A90F|nr:hypothetical protein [uncultured Psychroserpens sp.]